MGIKDIIPIAAAFLVPLVGIEIISAWRNYSTRSLIQDQLKRQKIKDYKKKKKQQEKLSKYHKSQTQASKNPKTNSNLPGNLPDISEKSEGDHIPAPAGFTDGEVDRFLKNYEKSSKKQPNYPQTCPEETPSFEDTTNSEIETDSKFICTSCKQPSQRHKDSGLGQSQESATQNSQNPANTSPPPTEKIADALFFPEHSKNPPCKDYYFAGTCPRRNCTESHDNNSGVGKLVNYIFKSRDSIDVCQYTITSGFLADAILARHRLGVKVRVITDHEGANQISSQMEKFYNNGILVRPHRGNGLRLGGVLDD